MTVVIFNAFLAMGKVASTVQGDAAKAGAGLGIILGLGFLVVAWIVPTGGAALLGFLLKKNSIVERGPTGPLVGDTSQGSFVTGWAGVLATAVVALIVVGAVSTHEITDRTTPSSPTGAVQQETPAAENATLHWIYDESPDKMGRGTVKTATIRSLNEIEFGFPYQGRQRMTLMLRVHPKYGKNVILSIERGQFLCRIDGCAASVRFDQGKPETYSASEPADNSTTYLFIGNYDRFLTGLRKSKKVSVEAQFYQEGSPVFEFDTSGLEW